MAVTNTANGTLSEMAEAQEYFKRGQAAKAGEICVQGLARNPDRPELLMLLAEIAHTTGDTIEAEQCIRRAVRRQPNDPHCHVALGLIQRDIFMISLGSAKRPCGAMKRRSI